LAQAVFSWHSDCQMWFSSCQMSTKMLMKIRLCRVVALVAAVKGALMLGPCAFAAATMRLRPHPFQLHIVEQQPHGKPNRGSRGQPNGGSRGPAHDAAVPVTAASAAAGALMAVAAGTASHRSQQRGSRCLAKAQAVNTLVAEDGFTAVVAEDFDEPTRRLPPIPQAAPAGSAPAWRERHWFPVASTLELDPKRPTPVRIDGIDLVVWQVPGQEEASDGGWRVMVDACPHRLAPLSEGRLEPKTGCLQCAYHGWEFDGAGSCACIPQVEEAAAQKMRANPRSRVRSFPTKLGLKLVWVWLGDCPPKGEPEDIARGTHLLDDLAVTGSYTRDLPYGYDALLENFVDVSHIPFAHHGLQGTRDDATPITLTMPEPKSSKAEAPLMEFTFADRTMGMRRSADFSLRSPFFFFYNGEMWRTEAEKNAPFRLNICIVPVGPGWSRAIIIDARAPDKGSLLSSLLSKLPRWVVHILSNKFLDSDLAFLHYQERKLRQAPNSAESWTKAYYMPGECDRSISVARRWLQQEGARCVDPTLTLPPSPASREELLNRFEQHTTHCRHCREAYNDMETWQRGIGAAGLVALILDRLALGPTPLWLFGEILAVGGVLAIQELRQQMRFKDYEHFKS